MKNSIYSILTLVLIFLLGTSIQSCSKYESPLGGQIVNDVILDSSLDSKSITIGNNNDLTNITATSSESWCTVMVASKSINISVEPNETYEERKAVVTLTDSEDGTTLSFNVIQKQNDVIKPKRPSFSIPEEGGTITIDIESNVNYTVEIPSDCNWLSYKAGSRGLTTSSISLTATKNDSGDRREAVVKLKKADSEVLNTITISQKFTPRIKLEKDEFTVYDNGGVLEIPFSSNVEVKVKNDNSWIKNEGTTKISEGSYSLKLKIDANLNSTKTRVGTIELECANSNWSTYKTITIYQIHGLSISPTELELLEGDTYSLQLSNNTDQSVKWSSSNTSVATINNSGRVTAVNPGSAIITVKTQDGKLSAQMTVTVKEKDKFNIEVLKSDIDLKSLTYLSYADLRIKNVYKEKIRITGIKAYDYYGDLLCEISSNKQINVGEFYDVKITTSKGTIFESYFWGSSWALFIYYTKESNNNTQCEIVRYGGLWR